MLDGANQHAYTNTNWPRCQRCKGEMRLANQTPDHYAFVCPRDGAVRAWSTPSSRARAAAQTAVSRREQQAQRIREHESRPLYFDMGRRAR